MSLLNKCIITALTGFVVWMVLLQYGVFEFAKGKQIALDRFKDAKEIAKKRKRATQRLSIYAGVCNMFHSLILTEHTKDQHQYFIDRLDIRCEELNRKCTVEEVRGKHFCFTLACICLCPLVILNIIFIAIPLIGIGYFLFYPANMAAKIRDEDTLLQENFLDLYLLLYSKLRMGSRARLQSTVENYAEIRQSSLHVPDDEPMLKFSKHFLNLLSLYEDHVAVSMLRHSYRSAMIINFCNVAGQALQGIDNYDNLLTFKMSLEEQKVKIMRKKQQKILRSGERSIYLIYLILFIFIAVGWYSKLPMDMISDMF